MKTTDNYDIEQNGTYYSEHGETFFLQESIKTSDGRTLYLVTPYIEGEFLDFRCYDGEHTEINLNYEHEGEPRLVERIYKNPPTFKLEETYAAKKKEIEAAVVALGEIKIIAKDMQFKNNTKAREYKELESAKNKVLEDKCKATSELESMQNKLNEKRTELSDLEDRLSEISKSTECSKISVDELARLRRRDFMLASLESGGVDNWEWFDESLKDYRERYPS